MLGVFLSLSLFLSLGCCCPTESTARPTPVYYYLFKPMDSTCTASTLMNWFAVWEAREEKGGWVSGCWWVAWLKDWGVWENAFLLGKGGWEWQRGGDGHRLCYEGCDSEGDEEMCGANCTCGKMFGSVVRWKDHSGFGLYECRWLEHPPPCTILPSFQYHHLVRYACVMKPGSTCASLLYLPLRPPAQWHVTPPLKC